MHKYCFILFLLLLSVISGLAQLNLTFQIQQFNTENGLPSNGIKGMEWDEKTNFLWLSTEAGIVRYDGVTLKSFTKENMPSIKSERILFMMRNYANKINVIDLAGNIFFINENKPIIYKTNEIGNSPYFSNYYLLAASEKFFQKAVGSDPKKGFSLLTDKVVPLNDTACLILTNGKLYYNSITAAKPLLTQNSPGSITHIFKIGESYFLIKNDKDVFMYDPASQILSPVSLQTESGISMTRIISKASLYWDQGMPNPILINGPLVWQLSYKGKKVIATLIFDQMPTDALIKTIKYNQKDNTLFVGTQSKGLFIINQTRVEPKRRSEAFSKKRNSYYSQIELENGNVLTNEGDIIGENKPVQKPLPIKGSFSNHISYSADSLLWYSQLNVITKANLLNNYNYKTGQTQTFDKIRSGPLIASSGNTIFLVDQDGIYVLDNDSLRLEMQFTKKGHKNDIYDFKEIGKDTLAIATCNGLILYNTKTKRLDTILSKKNVCFRSIWKYKDYIFFGTYGSGFYMMKGDKLKLMPVDKNRYLNYAHCFVQDDYGFCWLSTNRGLFKASLEELIYAFENNTSSVYYHYFGKNDGMEMTELNGGCTPCAIRLKNGIISFPSMDGLIWVSPTETRPILPAGEIYIDEIIVDNKIVDIKGAFLKELPPSTAEVIISLSFSAWCKKENIYLEYRLNDAADWKQVPWIAEPAIQLNNLPSGKYTLHIRKKNGFGTDNYSYKEIGFTILTPWYNQWWFYVLCAAGIIGIIFIYSNFKTRQFRIRENKLQLLVADKTRELVLKNESLEKNNSLKTRLISIISHDIVTPLKFVTAASKKLAEKGTQMDEGLQQETIHEIANTSQELHLLSTNILNWIKYQNQQRLMAKETFNVHELVQQVFGVVQSLAKQKHIFLVNEIEHEQDIYQYFEPLKIAVYNVITNAINFSENGKITVTSASTDNAYVITITDEGSGMKPEQIANILNDKIVVTSSNNDMKKGHGLGYLIIKDVLKTMNGSLHINSEAGKFTQVSLVIPV